MKDPHSSQPTRPAAGGGVRVSWFREAVSQAKEHFRRNWFEWIFTALIGFLLVLFAYLADDKLKLADDKLKDLVRIASEWETSWHAGSSGSATTPSPDSSEPLSKDRPSPHIPPTGHRNPQGPASPLQPAVSLPPSKRCDNLVPNFDDLRRHHDQPSTDGLITDPSAAVDACTEAIEQSSNNPRLVYQRGLAYKATGETTLAESDFQAAERQGYPPALARHAHQLFNPSAGETQVREAIALYEKAQNGSADAMYWMGRFEYLGLYEKYGIPHSFAEGRQKIHDAALFGSDLARRDPVSNYQAK